jgi:hypothetical protein
VDRKRRALERSFEHVLDEGGMRRATLRGKENLAKRHKIAEMARSKKSKWVRHEAAIGAEKGALVSVLIERSEVPSEFASNQAADLTDWNGDPGRAEVQALLSGLAMLVAPSRLNEVRPGYDPAFLDPNSRVTLPAVTGPAVVLRYLHFTVVMHPGRRLAHYVAYNVDGTAFLPVPGEVREWAVDPGEQSRPRR